MAKWKQGKLPTKNLLGYNGKQEYLTYRSSWEFKAIKFIINLVKLGKVRSWNSEETVIKYYFSLDKEPKPHRYFIDFSLLMSDGSLYLVEVKPKSESAIIKENTIVEYKPPRQGRSQKSNEHKMITYVRNGDKWNATCKLCQDLTRNTGVKHNFVIWTEENLKIK